MIPPLEKQLIEAIHQLDSDKQQQVLDFVRELTTPRGVDGKTLLEFAGQISPEDLDLMEEAIAELGAPHDSSSTTPASLQLPHTP